jgi:tRNA threonylcarbamoyladenosine biosynthesis protein TsaE
VTELVFPLSTRRATRHLAKSIGRTLAPSDLVIFGGPLGAGKTFLVRAVCRALGLDGSLRVTSPTFSLVHEYPSVPPVFHVDLYRLRSAEDVHALGLLEQRDQGKILLVEWGEPYLEALGGDALLVTLEVSPRRATVVATGPISRERLGRLL